MPLGIITDTEMQDELERFTPTRPSGTVVTPHSGRTEGAKEVPDSVRKTILDDAIVGTPSAELQQLFNVSPSSVSAYKNGAASTASYNEDQPLKDHRKNRRATLLKKAEKRTSLALDQITEEKLSELSARDNAAIARDMSAVIKNLTPEETHEDNRTQIVFFAPSVRSIEDFPVRQLHE